MLNGNGLLVGMSAKIGGGKDTFAALLRLAIWNTQNKPGNHIHVDAIDGQQLTAIAGNILPDIKIVKFADALKDITCRLTGCTREQLESQEFKDSAMSEEWWEKKDSISKRRYPHYKGVVEDGDEIHKFTYRTFLQELGTDVLRNWIPNIHVNATFSAWKPTPVPVTKAKISGWGGNKGGLAIQKEAYPKWIITDMRFPNELIAIQQRGGITIRINRPDTAVGTHLSEIALDDYQFFDEVIDNDGTMEDLYNKALIIVNKYKLHEK